MEGIIIVRNIPATDYDDDNNDVDKVVKDFDKSSLHSTILEMSHYNVFCILEMNFYANIHK